MSRFDKIKDSFGILQTQKEPKEPMKTTNAAATPANNTAVMNKTREESMEEEVQRYFKDNPNDLLQRNESKGRTTDAQKTLITKSKRLRAYEPNTFADVKIIGEEIKIGKIVLVNFKCLTDEDTLRVENFLYGMCMALDIEPEVIDNGLISYDPQHTSADK